MMYILKSIINTHSYIHIYQNSAYFRYITLIHIYIYQSFVYFWNTMFLYRPYGLADGLVPRAPTHQPYLYAKLIFQTIFKLHILVILLKCKNQGVKDTLWVKELNVPDIAWARWQRVKWWLGLIVSDRNYVGDY